MKTRTKVNSFQDCKNGELDRSYRYWLNEEFFLVECMYRTGENEFGEISPIKERKMFY